MRAIGWVCGFALALWAAPCSAGEPAFRFSRVIEAPSLSQAELLAVTLDTPVYEATRSGLPDVRLLDGGGGAVPFLLRKSQTTRSRTVRKTWEAKDPTVRPLESGVLEITVRLQKEDPEPTGLKLVSRMRDFEHRVRVYSSADGERWEPMGGESVIFDYSRYMDARRDGVRFGTTPRRQFRIVIDDVTSEQESELLTLTRRLRGVDETEREERVTIARRPFRIERIEFWSERAQERVTGDKKTGYAISGFQVEEDPDRGQTLILIDAGREPLTAFELQTPAKNFSRRVSVEAASGRGEQQSWRSIGHRTLSRIDFKGLQEEELTVDFPETRSGGYRLVIDNRDSPPLEVTEVEARGNVYELLFLASPGTGYRLAYGSEDAEPPEHDTVAIEKVLGEGFRPTEAQLGPVGPATGRATAPVWSDLLRNRVFLLVVVVLLLVWLAWGLYGAAKRVDDLPEE